MTPYARRPCGKLASLRFKDTEVALESYQHSVELDPGSWEAWSQIAYLLERRGDHIAATEAAKKALAIGTSRHNENALAAGYSVLGTIEADAGRINAAKEFLEKARGYFLAAGSKAEYAKATNNLARLYFSDGNYDAARRYYDEALTFDNDASNERGAAADYEGIAEILFEQQEYEKALDYFKKSLAISENIDDRHQAALALSGMGRVYQDRGRADLDNAKAAFLRALELEQQLDNQLSQAYIIGSLANLERVRHDYGEAESRYLEAIRIAKEVSPFAEAVLQRGIGRVYLEHKNFNLALDSFRRALDIDRALKRPRYVALDQSWIGAVYSALQQQSYAC